MSKRKKPKLPESVRRHGAGYRAVFAVDGVRERSPTLPTPEDATAWKADFLGAKTRPIDQPLDLTLEGGLRLILEDLQATGGREGTREFYQAHARTLFLHLGGKLAKLHRIDTKQLNAFIAKRRAAGVAASTIVKRELQTLKRMLTLARDAGYLLPLDPFAKLRLPRVRTGRFGFLTQQRIGEMVAQMRKHRAPLARWHADIVELLFATGIRRAELCRLTVRDIDFAAGRFFVDGKVRPRYQTFGRTLEPLLRRLVAAAGKGGRLVRSVDSIEQAFRTWQKRLGEPLLTPHTLRHSHGTAMAQHVSPFDLMGLLGHSSLTQTSQYFHARGDAVRGALDSLRLDPPVPAPSESAPPSPSPEPPTQP